MSFSDEYDYLFKSVIVGDSSVGKTQILSRFIDNQFSTDSKPTVGVDFKTKTLNINNMLVKNQIWDTAGQQKYRALTSAYYRGAVGAIIVFDLSKHITFEHVQRWMKQIKQHSQQDVCILLIGNKSDLQTHQISQQEIQNFVEVHKLIYLSTSALSGYNIEEAFKILITDMIKKFATYYEKSISQDENPQTKRKLTQSDINMSVPQMSVDGDNQPQRLKKPDPPSRKLQPFDVQTNKSTNLVGKWPAKSKKRCC